MTSMINRILYYFERRYNFLPDNNGNPAPSFPRQFRKMARLIRAFLLIGLASLSLGYTDVVKRYSWSWAMFLFLLSFGLILAQVLTSLWMIFFLKRSRRLVRQCGGEYHTLDDEDIPRASESIDAVSSGGIPVDNIFGPRAFPPNYPKYMSDPILQLAVSWAIVAILAAIYASTSWNEILSKSINYSYSKISKDRLPGILVLSTKDDPFQVDLFNSTQPPACGFKDWYGSAPWDDCTNDLIQNAQRDNASCFCTNWFEKPENYISNVTWNGSNYTAYNLSVPFKVSQSQTLVQYWIWPNLSEQQTNNPNVSLVNCSRSSMKLALYDAEDESISSFDELLLQDRMLVYSLPAGNIYGLSVQKETLKMINGSTTTSYNPFFSPGIDTGDCSTAISIKFQTMTQVNIIESYDKSASDYASQIGGILTLIQGLVAIGCWLFMMCRDSRKIVELHSQQQKLAQELTQARAPEQA